MSSAAGRSAPLRSRAAPGANGAHSISGASRVARTKEAAGASSEAGAASLASSKASQSTTLGTRKRAALGDLTNANRARSGASTTSTRSGAAGGKDAMLARSKTSSTTTNGAGPSKVLRDSTAAPGKRLARSTTTAAAAASENPAAATRVLRRTTASNTTRSGTNGATRTAASRSQRVASRIPNQAEEFDHAESIRENKRIKLEETENVAPSHARDVVKKEEEVEDQAYAQDVADPDAKDAGWEDLDAAEADDPLMVAEYVNEIFGYMKVIEAKTMPNGCYMDTQNEIDWTLRGVLVDWLVETHAKFRMLPETLFLTLNIVDRFLTIRAITLGKLQLVGMTAMFIAAKYEEVLCPSVENFIYLADGSFNKEDILKAERYMLKVLGFNLSYANPMNFLRRISKADNYDIQTRTVAKYFMEISLLDHRLLEHPPSLVAAASVWMARRVLERGPWTPTLVHYSEYTEEELLGTAEIMLDYILRPLAHPNFHKKYASKKFMKASTYVVQWAQSTYPEAVIPDEDADTQDMTRLCVDLFVELGVARPPETSDGASTAGDGRSTSPLGGSNYDA